jgi:hypothetical protein
MATFLTAIGRRAALTDIIEAYERQLWPDDRIPGGKG